MTITEIQTFLINFYQKQYPPELRLGQAFIAYCMPKETNPDLFYCTDNTKATTIILEKYLDKKP